MLAATRLTSLRSLSRSLHTTSFNGVYSLPPVVNEPIKGFLPGSREREEVLAACKKMRETVANIPVEIGGETFETKEVREQVMPTDHQHVLAKYHWADSDLVKHAIETSMKAREEWQMMPAEHRAAIFLKASDLLAHTYRADLLAATMLGQGKNIFQAEIDAACETVDFYRFGAHYARQLYAEQPLFHGTGVWNRMDYRPLEGFIAAVSPFNFTAIGAHLCGAPALMGNTVVWKPSDTAILSNWIVFQVLKEAGLPDGVINFVPAHGPVFGDAVTGSKDLAGLAFTGSSKTFRHLWKQVGQNIDNYKTYPRLVGECGGKNFHLIHPSADLETVVCSTIRSAFEYQGQKCSACSRAYVSDAMWPQFKERIVSETKKLKQGDPDDPESFLTAVIDETSFDKVAKYLDDAKNDPSCEILQGGTYDKSKGYFIHPTIIQTTDPNHKLLQEELFAPVLTIHVYKAEEYNQTVDLVNNTSPYGLTGSIYARDREVLMYSMNKLKHAAGNLYLNDKSTGSVVGQQPFGGARASGTNDKAGAAQFLTRWVSVQSIKESFLPQREIDYPYMR